MSVAAFQSHQGQSPALAPLCVLIRRQVVQRNLKSIVVAGKASILRHSCDETHTLYRHGYVQSTDRKQGARTSRLGTRNLASSATSGIRFATQPTSNSTSCASTSALANKCVLLLA